MRAFLVVMCLAAQAAAQPVRYEAKRWDTLGVRIEAFGSAFAQHKDHRTHVAPGDKLVRAWIVCDYDETPTRRPPICRSVDRATYRKTMMETDEWFWRWAEATFEITDAPASAAVGRQATSQVRHDHYPDLGDRTIAMVQMATWEIVDEYAPGLCATKEAPCDPVPVRTGRKIRAAERIQYATLGDGGFGYGDSLFEMLGSGYLSVVLDLIVPSIRPIESKVLEAFHYPTHAPQVLAYLDSLQEIDPDLRLALAWDRAVLNGFLRDTNGFAIAYRALLSEYQARTSIPPSMKATLDRGLPQLEALAKASFEPPAGLGRPPS